MYLHEQISVYCMHGTLFINSHLSEEMVDIYEGNID